jgi:RNA polymerase sigma factor (sigma-70 family)
MGPLESVATRIEAPEDAPAAAPDHCSVVRQLFREHNRALVKFLLTRLSSDDALDVAQEAYVRLLQLHEPGAIGFLRGYLFRIAANLSVDRIRQRSVREKTAVELFDELPTMTGEEYRAITREEFDIACAAIEELPRGPRDAFALRIVEGYSVLEIADVMGIDERTVRKHVSRALLHCRVRLQGRSDEKARR